jgi:putative endonuclease
MKNRARPSIALFMRKGGATYILANRPGGTIYFGVTNDLVRRVYEHRTGAVDGFTKTYGIKSLVWFEIHDDIEAAIVREKQIKAWRRAWKINLIREDNPDWHDLYSTICR